MEIPEWWGHSPEHGWVVTHRDLRYAKIDEVPFYKCSDSSVVVVPVAEVANIVHGPSYYHQMGEPARSEAMQGFSALRAKWLDNSAMLDAAIERTWARALHEQKIRAVMELRRKHFAPQQAPSVRTSTRFRPPTHCYNCKEHLSMATNLECVKCGWMVCFCGACKCGTSF